MSTGGLVIGFFILALLNLSFGVYIFVKHKRTSSDPDKANNDQANQDRQRVKDGTESHSESALVDMLKDQLAYSREDVSNLQAEVEALTLQVLNLRSDLLIHLMANSKEQKIDSGKIEVELGKVVNRLDNYRLLLSQIEANTRK